MAATLTSTDLENDRCPACGKALSRLTTPSLLDEEREKLAKMIELADDEAFPPSWSDDRILGNRLARAWAAAIVRGGPVEGIAPQARRQSLPDEIAALIDRLRQYAGRWPEDKPPVFSEVAAHDDLLAAAAALSRLTAAPPPPPT